MVELQSMVEFNNNDITTNLNKSISISLCISISDSYDNYNFLITYLNEYIKYLDEQIIQELIISCDNDNDYNKILKEYDEIIGKYKKFNIYKNDEGVCLFLNKLKVSTYSTCDYIALIDPDNFVDANYFNTVRNYINSLNNRLNNRLNDNLNNKNPVKYSIFSGCELKNIHLYKDFENQVLTKFNVQDYRNNEMFEFLLNSGNYVFSKNIINSISFIDWNIGKVSSYDVIFFNLLCFKQLEGFEFHIIKDLVYENIEGNYLYLERIKKDNVDDIDKDYYNKYILPEYQNFKRYIILKEIDSVGDSLFCYLAYCLLQLKINEFNKNNRYSDIIEYEYISSIEYDIRNDYIFYRGVDLESNDIDYEMSHLDQMFFKANENENIKCFNTVGFFKNKFEINNLKSNQYINDNILNSGLYMKNNIILNNSNFKYYIQNISELIGKNITLDDSFKFDYIYLKYKDEIFDMIKNNKDKHSIFIKDTKYLIKHFFDNILLDELGNYNFGNYNFVIHICLNQFNEREFIQYEYLEKVLDKIRYEYPYLLCLKNAIVIDKINSQKEIIILNKFFQWFTNNKIDIKIELNDTIRNFHIIKNANILLSSMNSYSWMACYLSNSVKHCFMPNYNFFNENNIVEQSAESSFKHPIKNTILYNVPSTNSLMKRIKVIILTLKECEYNGRFNNMENLIIELSEIGLDVEIYNGVYGKDIKIYNTDKNNLKILYHNKRSIVYDTSKRVNGEIMGLGELGCAWSQINIYNKLLYDNEYDQYLILEDDAFLLKNINKLKELLLNLPGYFDVCHIGYSDWNPFEKSNKINDYFYSINKNYFNRCTSYILSKTGAQKILSYHNRVEIKENYRIEYSDENVISSPINNCITLPSDDLLCHIFLHTSNFKLYVPETPYFHIREDNVSVIERVNGSIW
jgi:GR25 family glycosyltransferase involved in LPS biosynthesis